jgi:hypothetical protein
MKSPPLRGSVDHGDPPRRGPDGYIIPAERRRRAARAANAATTTSMRLPASAQVLRAMIAAADALNEHLGVRGDRTFSASDLRQTGSELAELVRRYQAAAFRLLQEWLRRPRYGAWLADSASGRVLDILEPDPTRAPNTPDVHISAADDQSVSGLGHRFTRAGIGIPVVAWTRRSRSHHAKRLAEFTAARPQTAVIRVDPDFDRRVRHVRVSLLDPTTEESVRIGDAVLPLAADFSAPVAATLARERRPAPTAYGLRGLARRGTVDGFVPLTPFAPSLEPLILVEGGGLPTQLIAQLANVVAGTPELQRRYQVWAYRLPSATPLIYMASRLRTDLRRLGARVQASTGRAFRTSVVGHGIGAVVARSLLVDSGSALWDVAFSRTMTALGLDVRDGELLESLFVWNANPAIDRVVAIWEPDNRKALTTGAGVRSVELLLRQNKTLRASIERIIGTARPHIRPATDRLDADAARAGMEPFYDDPVCHTIANVALAADQALLQRIGPEALTPATLFVPRNGHASIAGQLPTGMGGFDEVRIIEHVSSWLRVPE